MTAENFPACLAIILREEGGSDDDPHDHGGRTSRGITQREWDIWRSSHDNLPADVWQAPQDQIDAIYRQQYWNPYCDNMPAGLDLVFFNASVNSGRSQAVKELQRALKIPPDGMLGMVTMAAIDATADIPALIHNVSEQRRNFYRQLAQFPRYGKGWMARTDRVEVAAAGMAPAATAPVINDPVETQSPKALPTDMSEPTVSAQVATGGAGGTAILSGVSDQLQQVSSTIQPLSDTFKYAKYACLAITVILALFGIYAIIRGKQNKAVT
jgi:lysozyme family protein